MVGLTARLNPVLVAFTAVAVATASLAALQPRWGMLLFFAWLPVIDMGKRLLWLFPGATPSNLEHNWILILPDLILLFTVARVALDAVRTRRLDYEFSRLDLPVGLFFGWSLLSILNPNNSLYPALAGFKSSSMYILLYVLLRVQSSAGSEWLRRLTIIVAAGTVLASLYAIFQTTIGFQDFEIRWLHSGQTKLYEAGSGLLLGPHIASGGIPRPFSTMASHEQLGWYIGFAILLVLARPKFRWFHILLFMLFGFVLIRTLSRSSWVFAGAAFLTVVVLALRYGPRAQAIAAGVAIAILVASYAFLALTNFGVQTEETATEETTTEETTTEEPVFESRALERGTYAARIETFRNFLEDPTWRKPLGNGIGSMWYAWWLGKNPAITTPSHVGTIDIIYELGFLGLGLFIWVVVHVLWRGLQYLRDQDYTDQHTTVIVAMAAIVAVVVANSTVTTILIFRPISAFFWLMVGVIAMVTEESSEGNRRQQHGSS